MKDPEIDEIKQRISEEIRLGITQYYAALDELQANRPHFDLDVATDVHPELADYTSVAGHTRLKFWNNLYDGLETKPKYTVVRRYSTQQNSYHGIAMGLETSVAHAWLEVYEDLTPQDVSFERDETTGETTVNVNKYAHISHTPGAGEPTHLFSSNRPSPLWKEHLAIAHAHEPEVFFYQDESHLLMGVTEYGSIAETGTYLPVRLDEELRELVTERIETSGLIDN